LNISDIQLTSLNQSGGVYGIPGSNLNGGEFSDVFNSTLTNSTTSSIMQQYLSSSAGINAAAQKGLLIGNLLEAGTDNGNVDYSSLVFLLLWSVLEKQESKESLMPLLNGSFGETNKISKTKDVSYSGEKGSKVVSLAESRLGDPYSQPKAGRSNYTDCSYLSQWCYKQVGVNIPRTAAEQARHCEKNGFKISKGELKPGDLVFFSHSRNGRYRNITHVAIYAGDGKIVDASSSKGKVVKRPMIGGQVMYARPKPA